MICFLTSRMDDPKSGGLNPANGFIDELFRRFPSPCDVLYVCSDPEGWEKTDLYGAIIKGWLENAGFPVRQFITLDSRNESLTDSLVRGCNVLILAGGHVPTQNRFLAKIGLKEALRTFDGVLIGISAGSMNCADTVYAQPEEDGEAVDPGYRRFLPGLGLTKTCLLPHFQDIRNNVLDGLRILEDVTFPDSADRTFYAIPDGSYLLIDNGREELRGEAFRIRDGFMEKISAENSAVLL